MVGIFTCENNVYTNLDELEGTSESSHQIFDAMLNSLQEYGLQIKYITVVSRSDSYAQSSKSKQAEPCLSLFVADRRSYREMGIDDADSNWGSSYPGTRELVNRWSMLCRSHGLPNDYYSDEMFLFVYDLKKIQLDLHIRTCKPFIKNYFQECAARESDCKEPSEVFVSSEPAVRIFYHNAKQLADEAKSGNMGLHRGAIDRILAENDRHDCYEANAVLIDFLDCDSEAENMYGFFRED